MGSKKEIIEAALKLSEEERLEMADLLFDSVGGPPDSRTAKEWDEEIQRRIKAVDAGETKVISWGRSTAAYIQAVKEQHYSTIIVPFIRGCR